jgi:hypothetical protein
LKPGIAIFGTIFDNSLVLSFTYLPITGKETHGFFHALREGRGPFPYFIEAVRITHFRGAGGI